MIRVIELFAGIGAQASALERLGIEHERVAVAEIKESTYETYCAIHGPTPNLGDITKVEHLPECDLLTYSSPCQDISIAGNKAGLSEGSGTRSALLWEVGRLLEDMRDRGCLPEVLLMENVDSILHKHARKDFDLWVRLLDSLGYTNSYQVINAKDHGIPQNRRRLFMVSTLSFGKLVFPPKRPLELCLKDMLETDVDESYYLTPEQIEKYDRHKERHQAQGHGYGWNPMDPERERVGHAILTNPSKSGGNCIIEPPKSASQGEPGHERERGGILIQTGDLNLDGWYERRRRVYSPYGISPTVTTNDIPKIEVDGDE